MTATPIPYKGFYDELPVAKTSKPVRYAQTRSEWDILAVERDHVTIRDRGTGMSVTNDAENVVAVLRAEGLLPAGRRLFYYDTQGELDEITWTEDGKVGFRPGVSEGQP